MIDPTYVSETLAWLAVWTVGGMTARQWLARRDAAAEARAEHERAAR